MIISDTSKSYYLIQFLLTSLNKDNSFVLGSHFEKDLKSEEYTAAILQKIQGAMLNGEIIIMNNLESLYPSLYDLFNQTFVYIENKKYARISIGASTDSSFEVNNNFKCIILVDSKDLNKQDRPFLNRFEKQNFTFENLLNDKENNLAKSIYEILKNVIITDSNNYKSDNSNNGNNSISFKHHLINCNLEEIRGIIYKNKDKDDNEIKNIILEIVSLTFSQDIMVNIKYSNIFKNKYKEELNQIINYYNTKPNNFIEFLNQLRNGTIQNHQNIIFTFSKIFDSIGEDNEISNKIIDNTDFEKSIENYIDNFFDSNDKKYLIFQIKEDLFEHLNHIQNLIDNYLKNKKRKKIDLNKTQKYIIFIIHLKREILNDENKINNNYISHLSPYNQLFIDNLKGDNISITQFFDISNKDLLMKKKSIFLIKKKYLMK